MSSTEQKLRVRGCLPVYLLLIIVATGVSAACSEKKGSSPSAIPAAEYTKDKPGPWEGMEDSHVPQFDYRRQQVKENLLAYVILKNPEPSHYIEVMGIMDDEKKDVVAPVTFGRGHTTVQNFFTIDSFRYAREKKWRVYVKCSLHDLWTREIIEPK